jgi:parallel beta-helix repeat protein
MAATTVGDFARRQLAAGFGTMLLALTLATVPAIATAEVACGDTVGPGGTVTLTADVGPCDGINTAIIVDSATLDLGGHTVSCADGNADEDVPYGIVLIGKKAAVRNGTVTGCWHGVVAAGSGKHTVEGVTVRASYQDGIYVPEESAKNRLTAITAVANLDDGFEIRGSKNAVSSSVAQDNGEDGIDLVDGTANKVTGNTSTGNADDGVDVGGDRNKVQRNTIAGNGGVGITVHGARNRIVGNTVSGSGAGVDLLSADGCGSNKWRGNTYGASEPDCVR